MSPAQLGKLSMTRAPFETKARRGLLSPSKRLLLHADKEIPMCNLYSMTANREAILRLFRISENRAAAVDSKDAVFPGRTAPVVRPNADGERELVQMSWGFVLPRSGRAPRRVTNTRDDKARRSSFWRDSFEKRRCLVPVTCFAEPK
ncbi:MAG: SOS response-associated peptidase family protein, partial [Hyphomicrobium sp.]